MHKYRENGTTRIYDVEKTLADCFKYRNKVGLDAAVETLKRYVANRRVKIDRLMAYARICRVEKVIRPYLAALHSGCRSRLTTERSFSTMWLLSCWLNHELVGRVSIQAMGGNRHEVR